MPIIEGTSRLKTAQGEYSFAVDGGAVSTITLRSVDGEGGTIPAGSIIVGGYVDVTTACASATGTIAVNSEGAGDLIAAVGQGSWTTGRKDIVPDSTGSTAIKTTAARSLAITIATAAFTAGVFRVVVFYK